MMWISRFASQSSEPEFEPEGIHSVQVITEKSFVANKAEVLVQTERRFVRDFRF